MKYLIVASIVLFICSCSSFRGLPSHGGGKRFDEEQKMVSTSIKSTIDAMDLSNLKGKKVKLFMVGMETSGSGRSDFSGFRAFNPSWNNRDGNQSSYIDERNGTVSTRVTQGGATASNSYPLYYNIDSNYTNNSVITSRDVQYFEFILTMHCRLEGIQIVSGGQDADLFVAIDVLGTNRSRDDHILMIRDHLNASTEITYCCFDTKSGKVLTHKSSVGARTKYTENWFRLTNISFQKRKLEPGIHDSFTTELQDSIAVLNTSGKEPDPVFVKQPIKNKLDNQNTTVLKDNQKANDNKTFTNQLKLSQDELYQFGLDAAERQDKIKLENIINKLKSQYPHSEYIEILYNKMMLM